MTDTAKKRLAIDLDEIERQLRQTAPQHPAPKNDPLAELARIVGQEDPFRAILSADRAGVEPRRTSSEADDIFAIAPDPRHETSAPYHDAGYRGSGNDPYHDTPHPQPHSFDEFLDEADQPHYAQSPQQEHYADDVYASPAHAGPAHDHGPQYAIPQHGPREAIGHQQEWDEPEAYADPAHYRYDEPYDDSAYDETERPLAHSRKGMLTVAAVLGVAILGVASALLFSGGGPATIDGEPPVIAASDEPLKVAPQNPGGVEIPNQNRQIYGGTGDEETQIVDREEQPVDIGEVAREAPRVVLPPPSGIQDRAENDPISQVLAGIEPAQGLQSPPNMSAAVAALGEPRRVRTVSVRPDGTIIGSPATQQVAQAQPEPRTISDLVPAQPFQQDTAATAEIPQVASEPEPPTPTQPAPIAQPIPIPVAPAPVQRAESAQQTELAQQTPAAPAAPTDLSSVAQPTVPQRAPEQVASIPAPAAAPPVVQAPAQTGGYAVQLAIRDSEERAYQAFSQYQTRYSGIIGNVDPIVRRAEVNGNTIYRIRVGPYALAEANAICERIKGTGGDCFVARN